MQRLRGKLTYANVISTICLFLLLGGGTALAAQLAKNSVGSKQLKNNAVTAAKIKNGAVTGAKINLPSLGTVPSATTAANATNATHAATADTADTADTATNAVHAESANTATTAGNANTAITAGNANTVNGQSQFKVFTIIPPGTAGQQAIGTFGGFALTANCNGTSPDVNLVSPAGSAADMEAEGNGNAGPNREGDQGDGPLTLALDRDSTNDNERGETNFSAALLDGTVINGQLGYEDSKSFHDTPGCAIYGEITVG